MASRSDTGRRHISDAVKALWKNPAYAARMKARFQALWRDPIHIKKMEARFTPEVRATLSKIAKNRSFSAETRRRIGLAQKGKKRGPRPVEIVEKIAERQRGQPRPNQRGEKHHNWKGGKRPLRNRVEDNRWKTAVVERDGRTCRRCGSTTNLVAHHFKSWDDFPDLRLDVDNGITLCKACHMSVHERNDPAFVHIPGESCLKTSDRL